MSDHAEPGLDHLRPRPVPDYPCDRCGHLGIVHRRSGRCVASSTPRCLCERFVWAEADAAYTEALEARLRAVWAYLPELQPFVPQEALRPLYALTVLSSRPLTADDVDRAGQIAALEDGQSA